MKTNELRIGNYVIYGNETYQIDTIAEVFPTLNTDKFGIGIVDWNNIKPLPLTEKWLSKFGFIKLPNNVYNVEDGRKGLSVILYHDICKVIYENDIGCGYNEVAEIEYVHELQNLYFVLTQKELTLKKKYESNIK